MKNKFHKVSYNEFRKHFPECEEEEVKRVYDDIKLPKRATTGSAGYDIFAPFSIELQAGEDMVIPTGFRVELKRNMFLSIFPRSGLGFKNYIRLANTVGIGDADYFNADNEGHYMIKIRNEHPTKSVYIEKGKGIAQAIIIPFEVTEDDDVDGIRTGGFGSTDK